MNNCIISEPISSLVIGGYQPYFRNLLGLQSSKEFDDYQEFSRPSEEAGPLSRPSFVKLGELL